MKRKVEITALLTVFIISVFISYKVSNEYVTAAEIYDYSGFWALGNARISVDSEIYCCAFSGTTGYGAVVFPYSTSFTISCDYEIFSACASSGRFYYFTRYSNELPDCNIIVYDANSGLTDTFAVRDINVASNDLTAADSYGNIYFVNPDNPRLVKCFAMSGRPCAEISMSSSVNKLISAENGNVLAVCSDGNYLINSSGGCYYAGGGSDIFFSGNGYFSDTYGGVYSGSVNKTYSGSGASVYTPDGYVVYNSNVLKRFDSSNRVYEQADCINGVSRVFAVGNTVVTFDGKGIFDVYGINDFYKIQEETTAPPTQIVTEEITRPTEPSAETTELTEAPTEEITQEESFVYTTVYTFDDTGKYILGVLPSTSEEKFIGSFIMGNAEYVLQHGNNVSRYIANGDVITFTAGGNTNTYRIVVNRDFNCDGKFNNDDIEAMANLLLKGGDIYEWQLMSVDMNENGSIDLSDLYDCYLNT